MKQQKKNWPAESNMTALKTLSHTLLHLDIQPTKMSPLVVKHPFTDSGLAGIYAEDGSLSVGNLLDSPDALRTWRENFSRRINEAETAMNLFCMITKPYQFGYLRLAAAHLSEQDMASFLSYAWISTESPNNDPNVPFPVSWTVKMKKKQKETQDILSYHTQAAGCSDKARAKASGGRQPIEECGRTGL